MSGKRMIVIGEKESFIAMVFIRKVKEAGINCDFIQWNIDDINSALEDVSLITLYMEEDERPHEDLLHYLTDVMEEKNNNWRINCFCIILFYLFSYR